MAALVDEVRRGGSGVVELTRGAPPRRLELAAWPRRDDSGAILGGALSVHALGDGPAELEDGFQHTHRLAQIGTFAYDVADGRVDASAALRELFGAAEGAVLDNRWLLDHIHPDDRESVRSAVAGALASRALSYRVAFRIVRDDGAIRHVEGVSSVACDGRGLPCRLLGIVQDVSARHATDEARRRHLAFLEALDRMNRATHASAELEPMVGEVLAALLELFEADRTWLVYPCDPEAAGWHIIGQRSRPGVDRAALAELLPGDADELRTVNRKMLALPGALVLGDGGDAPVDPRMRERFGVRAHLAVVVRPSGDSPYLLGVQHCTRDHRHTPDDRHLFEELGRRLGDALTGAVMQRAVRLNEARLAEAERIARLGYWEHDLVTDRVAWSAETYRIFGLNPGSTITLATMKRLIAPEDFDSVRVSSERALAFGEPIDVVFRTTRRDGAQRYIHNRGEISFDAAGRPIRAFGTTQEVTDRVLAEQRVRASERQYRTLVESSPDIVIRYDRECRRIYVNPAYTLASGLRPGEILGLPVDGQWSGLPSVAEYRAALERVMSTGEIGEIARQWTGPRGELVTHVLHLVPERDEAGTIVGALAIGRDMTARRQAEEALRTSEGRLAEAERVAHIGYWERDYESATVTLSDEALRIFGMPPAPRHFPLDEWQRRFASFVHPDDRAPLLARVDGMLRGEPAGDLRFRIVRTDGETRHVHGRTIIDRREDGKARRLFGVMQDVTEAQRVEEALRENGRALAEAQQVAHIGSWRADATRGVTWSDETYRIFGVSPASYVPSRAGLLDAVQPDDRRRVARWLDEIAASSAPGDLDFRILRPDGELRWVSGRGAWRRDPFTGEAYITGTVQDVTDRYQSHEALRATEQQLATLVENLPDLVARLDRDGCYVYASASFARSVGLASPEGLIGRRPRDLARPDWPAGRIERLVARVVQEGRAITNEATALQDGTEHIFELRHVPELDASGRVTSVLSLWRDITEQRAAESRLRVAEGRFRAVIDHATDMLLIHDLTSRILDLNQRVVELLGFSREELIGNTPHVYDTGIGDGEMPEVARRIGRGEIVALDRIYRRKDGTTFPVEVRIRGVPLPDGVVAVSMVRDITERVRAEARIRRLNRTYAVLSEINQLIVRERTQEGILRGACRTAVGTGGFAMAIVGVVPDDAKPGDAPRLVLGAHDTAHEVTPEIRRHLFGETLECRISAMALATCEPFVLNDLLDGLPTDRCGAIGAAHGYAAMASLPLSVGGRCIGVFNLYHSDASFFDEAEMALLGELAADLGFAVEGCHRDVERQLAATRLAASEERFRELAETLEDVFWIVDATKRRTLYVSPAYEKVWGRPLSELHADGSVWMTGIHEEDRARVAAVISGWVDGVYGEEYRIVRPDGSVRWVRDRGFAVRGRGGRVERFLGVARDITERRELEAQLLQSQKMEAIGQLAGGVAHDFNNLLGVMLMHAELAANNDGVDEETRASLGEIVAAIDRAALLTRQLLTFSRRQMMQPRDVDLNDSAGGVAKMLERIIGEDVRLELAFAPRRLMTHADPNMLEQVIMNLAVNARDAMPHGGRMGLGTAAVEVDAAHARRNSDASPGTRVCVWVSDEGGGIAPDVLPRIFEPFFTTKEAGKGTGLGLATVFGIVKQHQGWIEVETELGKGSTFRVYLPALAEAAPAAAVSGPKARPAGGSETVLLVEDEPAVRALARRILERHGYTVLKAGTGREALDLWHAHKAEIALLLTDLVMPAGMSGIQLARTLLEERPSLRVLFMSGYNADVHGSDLQLRHGEAFLKKPFGQDQLLAAVRARLDA